MCSESKLYTIVVYTKKGGDSMDDTDIIIVAY